MDPLLASLVRQDRDDLSHKNWMALIETSRDALCKLGEPVQRELVGVMNEVLFGNPEGLQAASVLTFPYKESRKVGKGHPCSILGVRSRLKEATVSDAASEAWDTLKAEMMTQLSSMERQVKADKTTQMRAL